MRRTNTPALEDLLQRPDLWRGTGLKDSLPQDGIDTGHATLNTALLGNGWPTSTLIEVCQSHANCEWLLLASALKKICTAESYIALLNPPSQPYAVGLTRHEIPLDQVLIITPQNKRDFLACFIELSRSKACHALLAWQPKQNLSYTELRKCQLAVNEAYTLSVLFRAHYAKSQSSPANLRLLTAMQPQHLSIQIFKQRGNLHTQALQIALPNHWQAQPSLNALDQSASNSANPAQHATPQRPT